MIDKSKISMVIALWVFVALLTYWVVSTPSHDSPQQRSEIFSADHELVGYTNFYKLKAEHDLGAVSYNFSAPYSSILVNSQGEIYLVEWSETMKILRAAGSYVLNKQRPVGTVH